MIYVAAGERYLDIDKVIKSPAIEFLNFMNFYKKKCELDFNRIKNQK